MESSEYINNQSFTINEGASYNSAKKDDLLIDDEILYAEVEVLNDSFDSLNDSFLEDCEVPSSPLLPTDKPSFLKI